MSSILEHYESQETQLSVARRLSPEDICVGDCVMVSEIQYELPSFLWCDSDPMRTPPELPVRISFRASTDFGPLKVKAVCLPFVLCKSISTGARKLLDIRQVQLMRLANNFEREAKKMFRSKRKKKNRK